jgi:hypothetical protein
MTLVRNGAGKAEVKWRAEGNLFVQYMERYNYECFVHDGSKRGIYTNPTVKQK